MMRNQLTAGPADQAQAILGAWRSGDIKLFNEELYRAGNCAVGSTAPGDEERVELLRAIAADLRVPSIQPPVDDPGNVYSNLLRHLAFSHQAFSHQAMMQAGKPLPVKTTSASRRNTPALVQ